MPISVCAFSVVYVVCGVTACLSAGEGYFNLITVTKSSYKKYWNLSVRFCILDFMGSSSNLPILQDLEKESDTPLQQVSIEEILEEQRVEQQTRLEAEKLKVQALKDRGLSIPRADTLDEY